MSSPRRVVARYLSRSGAEITFREQEETSAHDAERGWVLYRVIVSVDGVDAGYMKISYIPRENWDRLYPTLAHFVNTKVYWGQFDPSKISSIMEMVDKFGWLELANQKFHKSDKSPDIQALDRKALQRYARKLQWALEKKFAKEYEDFKTFHLDKPLVDYAHLEPNFRGKKIGASLYNYCAKWLADTNGLALWASGLQTPEAKRLWSLLTPEPGGRFGSENGRRFLSYL